MSHSCSAGTPKHNGTGGTQGSKGQEAAVLNHQGKVSSLVIKDNIEKAMFIMV